MIHALARRLFPRCRALAAGLLAACAGPVLAQSSVVFTAPGTTTWTAPAGVTSVTVRAWGGGGSGGTRNGSAAGGGGGGAFATSSAIAVVPGSTYTVTVGAGGAAVTTASTSGQAGGASSFPSVIAAGGAGGNTSGAGGAGGTTASSAGTTRFAGGAGGTGQSGGGAVKGGGGGGGSATATGNGTAGGAGSGGVGGAGGNGQGAGGAGGGAAAVGAGTAPGGGGGAPADGVTPSGAGAPGRVEIDYRINQTITFDPAPTVVVGGTGTVNATGGASGNPVTYSSTTTTICSFNTSTRVVTGLTAGNCVITANQAGNANYNAAAATTQTIVIAKGNQTVTFAAQPDQTYLPSNATFALSPAATASSGLAVSYTSTTTAVCTVGSATVPTITIRGAGTCTITASQAGNANWNAAVSVAQNITINKATQVITFNAQTTGSRFLSGTTFAISPVATTNAAGLTITYSSLTTDVCTVSGTTVRMVGAGTCTLAANQATGNANYTAAAQVTQNVTINPSFVINSATVNGASNVTLAQGLQLNISVDVTVAAGVALKGLRWVVAQSAPAAVAGYACENTTDTAATNGDYTVSFVGYSPASAGTYNLYLIAYSGDTCATTSGNFFSPIFVLPNAVTVIDVPPVAQYRVDECFWTAAAGQVFDTSGYGNHGTLVGTVNNVEGGLINRALSIPSNTSAALQQALNTGVSVNSIGSAGTITFWYRSNAAWVGGGDRLLFDATAGDKYFALALRNTGVLAFGFEDSADTDFSLSTAANAFAAGEWVHIGVSWSYLRDRMEITVNGTQAAVFSSALGPLPALNTIYIGDNRSTTYTVGGSPNSANGSFDEILIFASTLSSAQLSAIRGNQQAGLRWDGAATAATICIDHYELWLSGSSLSCLPSTATVIACSDASSPCASPYTGAGGATAVLSTSGGTLTSSTLTFNAVGVASTTLTHPSATDGSTVTVTLSGESITANNPRKCCVDGSSCSTSNSCSSVFNTAGFIVASSAGGATATIPSQTAGTPSSNYMLRAVRTNTDTGACMSALPAGTNSVDWAVQCNNPDTCSTGTLMSLTGSETQPISGNPNSGVATYTGVNMDFDASGNAPFRFTYADVGQVTLHARKSAGGSLLTTLSGSSNAFIVKPGGFTLSALRQTAAPALANPAANGASGAMFVKAGESFSATVTATTAGGVATPNFGRETLPQGVVLTPTLVLPAGGATGTLVGGTVAGTSFSGGMATVSNLAFSEVGIITLTPSVSGGSYLGAGPVTGTASVNIGRFVPARFALAATSVLHRTALSCTPASSFSYLGENFRLGLTLTAQNASGATTQNYTGAFAKLDPTSAAAWNLVGRDGSTVFSGASGRLSLGSASGSWSNGVASGVTLFANASRAGTPDGPFSADFGVAPVDSDGVSMAAFDMASTSGGSNDRASVANVALRFGRLRLSSAIGPADRTLPLPVTAQYWSSGNWDTNTQDSCTTVPTTAFNFGNLMRTITSADTAATGAITIASGTGLLRLTAPAAGRVGTYDVALSLGSSATDASCLQTWTPATGDAATTGANLAFLRGAWCGGSYDNDPSARATFGQQSTQQNLIYRRENY